MAGARALTSLRALRGTAAPAEGGEPPRAKSASLRRHRGGEKWRCRDGALTMLRHERCDAARLCDPDLVVGIVRELPQRARGV